MAVASARAIVPALGAAAAAAHAGRAKTNVARERLVVPRSAPATAVVHYFGAARALLFRLDRSSFEAADGRGLGYSYNIRTLAAAASPLHAV